MSDIHTTQQLANAAEAFVQALGALFPGDTFNQFFHAETVRRAYWAALQTTVDEYATPDNTAFVKGLMNGQVLANPEVVAELLKLFIPGQTPNYEAVAAHWAEVLAICPEECESLPHEAELLFTTLAAELRQSNDVRLALRQLAQAQRLPGLGTSEADLDRLLQAALLAGLGAVDRQINHLLALTAARDPSDQAVAAVGLTSLARMAGQLPASAVETVWKASALLDDPGERLVILGQIAPRLGQLGLVPDPLALVQDTIESGPLPFDPALCVEVLLALAPHLGAPGQDDPLPSFQYRVLEGVRAIGDPASRVRALGALIENLPSQLQYEAVTLAFETAVDDIPNEFTRATALSELPPHLPPEFHARLLSIAEALVIPDARALLLGRLVPFLPHELQLRALGGALDAVEQISGDEARAGALIALARSIDAVGPLQNVPERVQQAIMVTFSIEDTDERARAFAALAPYLSPEMLTEAIQVIKDMTDERDRAITLSRLAPHLSDELQVAAFNVAQEIVSLEARVSALVTIAPYLSAQARAQALADALASALSIERRYERVVALVDLAPQLPPDLQMRALREALTASRSIPDESERSRALIFLAPHLPRTALADALADAYAILDPLERVPALSALMPKLPAEPRHRVARDVINLAVALKPAHHKASILASVAPVLPDSMIDQAVAATAQINTPYDQMHVLTALLPHRPDTLLDAALGAARAVPTRYQRVSALLELVPHTPRAQRAHILNEALETALGVEDDYDRASALGHLAPYIDTQSDVQNRQRDALGLALDACLSVADPAARAALLTRVAQVWAGLLTPAQSYPLWRRVVDFLRDQPYAHVLTDLAALAPVGARIGAAGGMEQVAHAIWDVMFGD